MAAELVGGEFLSATLQVASERLASSEILDYFRGRKLNDGLLKHLRITLLSINQVLDDAKENRYTISSVKEGFDTKKEIKREWHDQLKVAVFKVRDLLDEIATDASRQKLDAEFQASTSKVRDFFTTVLSPFEKEIESRIQEVLDELEFLENREDVLGLMDGSGVGTEVGVGGNLSDRLPATSSLHESLIHNGDSDRQKLIEILISLMSGNQSPEDVIRVLGALGLRSYLEGQIIEEVGNEISNDLAISDIPSFSPSINLAELLYTIKGLTYNMETLSNLTQMRLLRIQPRRNFLVSINSSYGFLRHLRYLEIFSTSIRELPDSICLLFNLQTVILRGCHHLTELPSTFHKLVNLQYLEISHTSIKELPDSICLLYNLQTLILRGCHYLTELPSTFHKLVNLQYLELYWTRIKKMPKHMEKLEQLYTLFSYIVGKNRGSDMKELEKSKHLRGALLILKLENVINPVHAKESNMKDKKKLEELTLGWSRKCKDSQLAMSILESLQPNCNLQKLNVNNYNGTRFPNWFEALHLPNLVSLGLSGSESCSCLPPLGKLPSLRKLRISGFTGVKIIGLEFYGTSSLSVPFRSLELLLFADMRQWEEWNVCFEGESFPCLQYLEISNCPRLRKSLPQYLPCLTKLHIVRCKNLEPTRPNVYAVA